MYKHFNNNPLGRSSVGDCAVRAVSKALGISWDYAHDLLADMSKQMVTEAVEEVTTMVLTLEVVAEMLDVIVWGVIQAMVAILSMVIWLRN